MYTFTSGLFQATSYSLAEVLKLTNIGEAKGQLRAGDGFRSRSGHFLASWRIEEASRRIIGRPCIALDHSLIGWIGDPHQQLVTPIRVYELQGIVTDVGIAIPVLRISQVFLKFVPILGLLENAERVRTREPPLSRRHVSRPEVIEARLRIPFFAGEALFRAACSSDGRIDNSLVTAWPCP